MALRTKTIEYAFPTNTTQLATNTRFDFTAITLAISETTSRTFLNVYVQIDHQCNDAVGGNNVTSRTIGIKLGAVAFNDVVRSEPIFEAYSTTSYRWTRDVTSYFNANFGSGTSETCQVGFIFNGQSSQSVTAKLVITYQFDDAAENIRTKTIKIPLDSPTGMQTNTLVEIGTNQVPQLTSGGFIPENSPTIRAMWFELSGNQDTGGSQTDFNLAAALDAEGEANVSGTWEEGNTNYANWFFLVWRRDDMSPTAAHAFKARTSTTGRVSNLCVVLCVTYDYNHSASSTILNSVEMHLPRLATVMGGSGTTAEAQRSQLKFMVEEPSTITLLQSAVMLQFNALALQAANNLMRVGSQSYRTYTWGTAFSGAPPNGAFTQLHRIDSGAAAGSAGLTLARGENTITLDSYMSDTDDQSTPFNVDAMAIVNYTSGKHSLGSEAHTKTTKWNLRDSIRTTGTTYYTSIAAVKPILSQPHYWVTAVGFTNNMYVAGSTKCWTTAEIGAGEGQGDGWAEICSVTTFNDENLLYTPFQDATALFTRHPLDPSSARLNMSRTRRYRVGLTSQTGGTDSTDIISDCILYVTFSSMPLVVERSTTPAQASLEINVYRADSKVRTYKTFTDADGDFTHISHTDALPHFCEAVLGTTYAGRSYDFTPTGSDFDITWTPASTANLTCWLRADLGVTTAGGAVSAWVDQSGSSNSGAQATGGSQPSNTLDGGDGQAAVLFDGTADQIEVTDSAGFASTTTFSVGVWARMAATFPTNGTLFGQWSSTATDQKFRMYVATGGNLVVEVTSGSSVSTATVSSVLAVNSWYHLAFVYDGGGSGSAGRLKLYINGVLQTSVFTNSAVPSSVNNPTGTLTVGSSGIASTYFNGHVGEVTHNNGTALTQDQVKLLYYYRPRFG